MGDGSDTGLRARRCGIATGCDVDPRMISHAVGRATQQQAVHYAVADALRLPFAGPQLDLVTVVTVLAFVADAEGAVREMARVLKPGGRLMTGELGGVVAVGCSATGARMAGFGDVARGGLQDSGTGVRLWRGRPGCKSNTCPARSSSRLDAAREVAGAMGCGARRTTTSSGGRLRGGARSPRERRRADLPTVRPPVRRSHQFPRCCSQSDAKNFAPNCPNLLVLLVGTAALAEGAQHRAVPRTATMPPDKRVEQIAEPADLTPLVAQRHVEKPLLDVGLVVAHARVERRCAVHPRQMNEIAAGIDDGGGELQPPLRCRLQHRLDDRPR